MKKEKWKEKITAATKKAKTYRPYFDMVVETLAGILAMSDQIQKRLDREPVLSARLELARALTEIDFLALAYFSELGLGSEVYDNDDE